MLTAMDVCELRMFYARYPWDCESNFQLPMAMLRADLNGVFSGGKSDKKPIDFMPFAKRIEDDADPAPVSEPRPYSRKQLKRIQKYKGW